MKNFYLLSNFIVSTLLLLFLFVPFRSTAQIMISYEGNNGKDMIASLKNVDGGDIEIYDFSYNNDRTLNSLKMTGYYEDETFSLDFSYTWSDRRLSVLGKYDGFDVSAFDFDLNQSYCVVADETYDCAYTFNYDADGYMVSMTEEGVPGTLTWEDGNLIDFQCGNYRRTLSYTNIDNNTNMDLGFCGVAMEGFPCMPLGKWSKQYPKYIAEYIDGQLSYEGFLDYVLDEKGRVIKMQLDAVEIENGKREPYTASMEISYDKTFETSIKDNVILQNISHEYYDINGRLLKTPKRGFNIIRGKDGITRKVVIQK